MLLLDKFAIIITISMLQLGSGYVENPFTSAQPAKEIPCIPPTSKPTPKSTPPPTKPIKCPDAKLNERLVTAVEKLASDVDRILTEKNTFDKAIEEITTDLKALREKFAPGNESRFEKLIETKIAAAIGAVILVMLGSWISYLYSTALENERREASLKGFLQAIHSEATALQHVYLNGIGEAIASLKPGNYLDKYFPLPKEHLTVYKSNNKMIGEIKNPDLSRQIIAVYDNASSIFGLMEMNNQLLKDLSSKTPATPAWKAVESQLKDCANQLRVMDGNMRPNLLLLLDLLKTAISSFKRSIIS